MSFQVGVSNQWREPAAYAPAGVLTGTVAPDGLVGAFPALPAGSVMTLWVDLASAVPEGVSVAFRLELHDQPTTLIVAYGEGESGVKRATAVYGLAVTPSGDPIRLRATVSGGPVEDVPAVTAGINLRAAPIYWFEHDEAGVYSLTIPDDGEGYLLHVGMSRQGGAIEPIGLYLTLNGDPLGYDLSLAEEQGRAEAIIPTGDVELVAGDVLTLTPTGLEAITAEMSLSAWAVVGDVVP